MHLFFGAIYDFFLRRKLLLYLTFAVSFAVWLLLALSLKFDEDISSMLPENKEVRLLNDVVSHTDAGEQVVFMISLKNDKPDADTLIAFANDYAQSLQESFSQYLDSIQLQTGKGYQSKLAVLINNNLPLFLTEDDYAQLDTLTTARHIEKQIADSRRSLLSASSMVYQQSIASDPIGVSGLAWEKLKTLRGAEGRVLYDNYVFSEDLSALTFFIKLKSKSSATGINKSFFKELDAFNDKWETDNVTVSYFGGAAVAAGNAEQMRQDTILTLSVTIVLLLIVMLYFYRRKRTALLILVPVLYGGVMGLGLVSLFKDSLSIIALGAGAIVMGIAIDFSIHFLTHARDKSVRETVKDLSRPLTIGSITTIIAFLALQLTSVPLLQDLGLFAAFSLLGAALCTLTFLPHFIAEKDVERSYKPTMLDKLAGYHPEKNKWLVLLIVIVTPVMLYYSQEVQFDSDLMNLNYMSPKLKKSQDNISSLNSDVLSSMYVIAEGDNIDKAVAKLERTVANEKLIAYREKGGIKELNTPTYLLLSKQVQQQRIARWEKYWTEDKLDNTMNAVYDAAKTNNYNPEAFYAFRQKIKRNYSVFDDEATALIKSLYPNSFAQNNNKSYAIATLKVPSEYREDVINTLSARKEITVTDRQQGALHLVDMIKDNFTDIAIYSSIIVFIALLIGYGRIELALVSFLPMVISWVWILGMMSLLNIQFNIVNIIISSLIFGLGDDYAIFTMDGLVERYRTGKKHLPQVRAAVYLSVLTAIIGLGVLLLAKHPALRSIAFISITGLLCVLFISQTLQPFLFNAFIQNRADKGFHPFKLRSFFISVFAFTYFFSGSLVLTVAGVILTKLKPLGNKKSKFLYHKLISFYTWSMMYIMGNVRKRVVQVGDVDFRKPAVYIANHSSFLDILLTTMLNPRMILLTNRWVWKSPVFGAVVRMADYYPVADGVEGSIEPLKQLVADGYSIMVFPEGTRSNSDKIHRFHKGAFYLSEQLGLDVVPVVLHGVHYTMQKGDWLLKDGTCSVNIYDRVILSDKKYGDTYKERAKLMGRWMREELEAIKKVKELPAYFSEQLVISNTYKRPVLEWYCRIKIKVENHYTDCHNYLPEEGLIYDLGCGYGFATYLLHWASPSRSFIGIDYDEEKIETAQNNLFHNERLEFRQGDLTQIELQPCAGIILYDVLHYMLPEEQNFLLEKCAQSLKKGGALIIRDGIADLQERIGGTKRTELYSTKIFRFNKVKNELHYLNKNSIYNLAERYGLDLKEIDHENNTANIIFIMTKV